MPKDKNTIERLAERVRAVKQPAQFTATDAANQRAIKIVTHNLKVAFSALIATQVGDKREHLGRAQKFLDYWDDCVRQASIQLRERFPNKQQVSDGELGMLRMAIRPLAKDGFQAGTTPQDTVSRALSLNWATDMQGEYEPNALPGDTEVVMMNTATGINRLYNAFANEVMRHDLEDDSKALVFGSGRTIKDTVLDVFLSCRSAATQITNHVVQDLGGSEVVQTSSSVASFTTTYINHVKQLMETSFARFLKDTENNWADPMKRHKMMAKGALAYWLDGQINDFTQICYTILDSAPELSSTEGCITAKDLSAQTPMFDKAAKSLKGVVPVAQPSPAAKPEEAPNERRYDQSFADLLDSMKNKAKPSNTASQS